MTPVGNTGIVPDPNKGLNLMSSILGIQQQRQALQTGAIQQQGAQAATTQEQQRNAEMQAAQGLAINGAKSGKYTNSDGSLNRQQLADDITKVAPTYGLGLSGQLLSHANEIVSNQQAHQNLNMDQQRQLGAGFGSLAIKKDASPSDFIDELDRQTSLNPDPKFKRMALSMAASVPANGSPQQLQELARRWSVAATNPESASAQSQPSVTTIQAPGGLQPTQMNPQSPGGIAPVGQPLAQGLAPTEKPGYIAERTSAGTRAGGVSGSDIDRANQVSSAVQGSRAAIPLTQHIDDLADQIHSGKFAASISKAAAAVGMKEDTYARQVLEKELGQVKSSAISSAGSDARAATIQSGYPEATADSQTIHTAMDYVRGSFRQNVARGDLLNTVKSKDPSLRGFQHADDLLTSSTDPLMHEFKALKSPEQQAEFYKRNFTNREAAKEFRDKVAGMGHAFGQ